MQRNFPAAAEVLLVLYQCYKFDLDTTFKASVELLRHIPIPEQQLVRFYRKIIRLPQSKIVTRYIM